MKNNAPITAPPPELSDEHREKLLKFREKLTERFAKAESIAEDIRFQKARARKAQTDLDKLLEDFDPENKKDFDRKRALEDQIWAAGHVIERFGDRPETSRETVENTLRVGVEAVKRALRGTLDRLHDHLAEQLQPFYRNRAVALDAARQCSAAQSYLIFLQQLGYATNYSDAKSILVMLDTILDDGRTPWEFTPEAAK